MECNDSDKVRPLDELLNDNLQEFESGEDKICDKELDRMIWELGDYENEEPPLEAGEFAEEPPTEEELVEKRIIVGGTGEASFREGGQADEAVSAGNMLAAASSLAPESRGRRGKARRRAG